MSVRGQFICTLYAGTFLAFTLCHIGSDIFINALLGGMADCVANITSGTVALRFGLLVTYRAMALVALILWGCLYWFSVQGHLSYLLVTAASYCTGCCLNYASATIVDQTPTAQLKASMAKTVTFGSVLSSTIPVSFLVRQQPIPMIGMCSALTGTVICMYFLVDRSQAIKEQPIKPPKEEVKK